MNVHREKLFGRLADRIGWSEAKPALLYYAPHFSCRNKHTKLEEYRGR